MAGGLPRRASRITLYLAYLREPLWAGGAAALPAPAGGSPLSRHIQGGRAVVREVLYMAALTARRYHPAIAAFAGRLAGRKLKVILLACMRKLLVTLNAMLRDGTDWRATA